MIPNCSTRNSQDEVGAAEAAVVAAAAEHDDVAGPILLRPRLPRARPAYCSLLLSFHCVELDSRTAAPLDSRVPASGSGGEHADPPWPEHRPSPLQPPPSLRRPSSSLALLPRPAFPPRP